MAKYRTTETVDAEQYLPSEDKIPKGIISDGKGSPNDDNRYQYMMRTDSGFEYLHDGDYIVTSAAGERTLVRREIFEANYKLVK